PRAGDRAPPGGGAGGPGLLSRRGKPVSGRSGNGPRGPRRLRFLDRRGRAPVRRSVALPHRPRACGALGPAVKARALTAVLLLAAACRGGSAPKESTAPGREKTSPTPDAPTAVRVAAVAHATLPVTVSAPGHTAALTQQKLRAPFAGTLTELRV